MSTSLIEYVSRWSNLYLLSSAVGLADTDVVAEELLSVLLWSLVSESELVPEFEL